MERPLEVSNVDDLFHSIPDTHPYQRDLQKVQEWHQQSQESHGSSGKSSHVNIDIDTHYNVIKDVYVPGEFKKPHTDLDAVSLEQHWDGYIRPNADL